MSATRQIYVTFEAYEYHQYSYIRDMSDNIFQYLQILLYSMHYE